MKKSIFLFFAAILCAMSVQGAAIKNISSVYIAGTMNNWSSNNSNWYLGSGNYNKKTFYVAKSNSNYEFKLVINGNWYTKDGYWYTNSNSGPFTGLSTSGNNMQIETKNITTSTKYVSLEFEFYGEYSNENRLTIKQSGVDALSPSLTPSSSNLSDGETSTITPSCSGGSGNYDYTYTVTCGGNDMTATTLSTTSGASVVFTAPTASVEKTYTITVTAKDSHALLSDLQATATTDIVVAASVEKTNIVKISYKCDEDDIETATFQEVGVSTASAIAAPVIAGYNFSNWTLGSGVQSADANANPISITTKASGDYTLTANYTEIPKTTVYFVNNKNWSKVNVYGWEGSKGENPGWPGADITANTTGEKIGEFDVYSYTVEVGSYNKIIFNDGSAQTANFLWTDGKYYYMGAATDYAGGTKEDVTTAVAPDPLATEVYLAGEMTNWGEGKIEFKKATAEATTASVKVNLSAKSYTFQLVIDGTWYGNKSTMQRGGDAVHEGGWSFEDTSYGANCTIVADIAGDYTFTWNLTEKKLTVAYPPLPKYTVTATAENGSVTGAGEYEQGSEATLVATPDAGYAFVNWKKGEEVVSSEASYTFTVTANTDLVATFAPEVTHEVTVSYLCNSNPIPGHDAHTLAVGVTTPSTITAPAITNYKFDSWTLGDGIDNKSANTTTNPINITTKASGTYTLTANYTKIELTYTVEVPAGTEKCYIAGDMTTEWSFVEMTKVDDTHFTITIEGATTVHKYKYAAGPAWAYVEKKADGSEAGDRTYNANDVVKKWASVYDPS
ncbi:MAG: starch-binding protein, partial [Paludibacteraceae bacterium]|nr:starch-binding protein [Paludibacteraceae bacterium]